MNQKGFVNIILAIVLVLLIGTAGYLVFVRKSEPTTPLLPPGQITTSAPAPIAPSTTPETVQADATYIRQHTMLLVNEIPPLGQMGNFSIYTVHGDGTGKTLLTSDGGAPSWTPDGKIIFVSKRSGSQQIWVMDADGSNASQIGNLSVNIQPITPQMGKNGLVVFWSAAADVNTIPDGNRDIWVMKQDGSGLRKLVRGHQPFLALSGTWITYGLQTSASDGSPYHREVWRINTDGTGKKQLTFLGDPDYPDANAPSISPDEQTVAFFSGKEGIDPGTVPGFTETVFDWGYRNVAVISAGGGARKTLTRCHPVKTQTEMNAATVASGNCIGADNPAWTPDGKWLIFDTGFSDGGPTGLVDINGHNFQKFYPVSRGIVRVALKHIN